MIRVLNDNVLVTDVRDMQEAPEGIILPDSMMQYGMDETASQRRYSCKMGTIVDFGPKARNIKKGQDCYLLPMKGKEFVQDGRKYSIYKYVEVIGAVE